MYVLYRHCCLASQQVNWPLGVDNIFSFTGDVAYLEANLPLVDKSFEFVQQHADELGLSTLVPVGKGTKPHGCVNALHR